MYGLLLFEQKQNQTDKCTGTSVAQQSTQGRACLGILPNSTGGRVTGTSPHGSNQATSVTTACTDALCPTAALSWSLSHSELHTREVMNAKAMQCSSRRASQRRASSQRPVLGGGVMARPNSGIVHSWENGALKVLTLKILEMHAE